MKNNSTITAQNNPTVAVFLRCPDALYDWLKTNAEQQEFRSVQEYILQILRERKESELLESEIIAPV